MYLRIIYLDIWVMWKNKKKQFYNSQEGPRDVPDLESEAAQKDN